MAYDNTLDNKYVRKALRRAAPPRPGDIKLGETTLEEMCLGALLTVRSILPFDSYRPAKVLPDFRRRFAVGFAAAARQHVSSGLRPEPRNLLPQIPYRRPGGNPTPGGSSADRH
jgi:hypothetical protein